jgi:PAS domain S-box-containing protein
MDIQDKSKEELISELQQLRQENNALKTLCDKDNSEHKQVEDALKQIEARLNAIISSMNDIVFEIDLNNCFEGYFAPKNKTLYIQPDKFIGKKIDEVHPEDVSVLLHQAIESINSGNPFQQFEYPLTIENTLQWEHAVITPRYNNLNEYIGVTVVCRDITERKRAEEELQESEKKYRLLAEGMADVVWILDIETMHFSYVSQSVEKLRGYTPEEVMAQPVKDSVTPESYKRVNDLMKIRLPHFLAQAEKKISYVDEIDQPHKNGSIVHTEVTTSYLLNEDGKLEVVGISRDITERKRAEDALKESALDLEKRNNYITTILENLAIGFSVHFIDSGVTEYINPAYSRVYGWPAEDMKDVESFFKLIYPDPVYSAQQMKMVMEDINSGDPERMHWEGFMITTKTGEERFIEARNLPLPDQNLMISTAWDITERKRADELLQTNYKRLDLAMQTANMAWWEMDIASGNVTFNPRKTEMLGYTPEKFNHYKDFMALVHPEDSDKAMNAMRKHLDGTVENYEVAYRILNNSGEYKWFYDIGSIVKKDSEGKPLKVTGLVIDITERKLAEDLLTESELKYRSLIENSSDAIFCIDEKGQYQFVNHHFSSIFGKTPEYFDGKTIWDLYDKEFADKRFELTKRLFKFGISESLEVELPLPDKTLYFWATANPIKDKAGKVILNLTHATDITELKKTQTELIKAKEKAEESDRLKSAFLANMSHEIRTPMNGILGFAELLKNPDLTGETQQEYIKIIEKSGGRMLNIINDIVDISKIEAGMVELVIQKKNINQHTKDIYRFFKPEADAKKIKFAFINPLPAKEATINTDHEKVYAILSNLVKNAIKFTHEDSIEFGYVLKGSTTQTPEKMASESLELQFFVKDTGIGIPKDRQEAIFERFIQADIEDKMAYQGAGLGLAISKAYVEMLGGEIWVESEKGKGSTFYFTLPIRAELDTETIDRKPTPSEKINEVRKLKILIVEDDETSEMLIDSFIKTFGEEILKARTGVEALEVCRTNPDIDLILMDIRMPDMGGYEATKQIREFNKEVIIIAQTAYAQLGDREKLISAGCNDYIAKPINKSALQLLIKKYFGK